MESDAPSDSSYSDEVSEPSAKHAKMQNMAKKKTAGKKKSEPKKLVVKTKKTGAIGKNAAKTEKPSKAAAATKPKTPQPKSSTKEKTPQPKSSAKEITPQRKSLAKEKTPQSKSSVKEKTPQPKSLAKEKTPQNKPKPRVKQSESSPTEKPTAETTPGSSKNDCTPISEKTKTKKLVVPKKPGSSVKKDAKQADKPPGEVLDAVIGDVIQKSSMKTGESPKDEAEASREAAGSSLSNVSATPSYSRKARSTSRESTPIAIANGILKRKSQSRTPDPLPGLIPSQEIDESRFFSEDEVLSMKKGDKLEALDKHGCWYSARIIQMNQKEKIVKVHYEYWNSRLDEWIEVNSKCLRRSAPKKVQEPSAATPRQVSVQMPTSAGGQPTMRCARLSKAKTATEFTDGMFVFARWGGKMYPAKILSIENDSDSATVVYYDGFEKTVKLKDIKKLTADAEAGLDKSGFGEKLQVLPKYPDPLFDPSLPRKVQGKRRSSLRRPSEEPSASSTAPGTSDREPVEEDKKANPDEVNFVTRDHMMPLPQVPTAVRTSASDTDQPKRGAPIDAPKGIPNTKASQKTETPKQKKDEGSKVSSPSETSSAESVGETKPPQDSFAKKDSSSSSTDTKLERKELSSTKPLGKDEISSRKPAEKDENEVSSKSSEISTEKLPTDNQKSKKEVKKSEQKAVLPKEKLDKETPKSKIKMKAEKKVINPVSSRTRKSPQEKAAPSRGRGQKRRVSQVAPNDEIAIEGHLPESKKPKADEPSREDDVPMDTKIEDTPQAQESGSSTEQETNQVSAGVDLPREPSNQDPEKRDIEEKYDKKPTSLTSSPPKKKEATNEDEKGTSEEKEQLDDAAACTGTISQETESILPDETNDAMEREARVPLQSIKDHPGSQHVPTDETKSSPVPQPSSDIVMADEVESSLTPNKEEKEEENPNPAKTSMDEFPKPTSAEEKLDIPEVVVEKEPTPVITSDAVTESDDTSSKPEQSVDQSPSVEAIPSTETPVSSPPIVLRISTSKIVKDVPDELETSSIDVSPTKRSESSGFLESTLAETTKPASGGLDHAILSATPALSDPQDPEYTHAKSEDQSKEVDIKQDGEESKTETRRTSRSSSSDSSKSKSSGSNSDQKKEEKLFKKEWQTGRESWLRYKKSAMYCKICRRVTPKETWTPFVAGVTEEISLKHVEDHEATAEHQSAIQKYQQRKSEKASKEKRKKSSSIGNESMISQMSDESEIRAREMSPESERLRIAKKLAEWRIGREDWLKIETGDHGEVMFCVACRHFASQAEKKFSWVKGMPIARVTQASHHEIGRTHKNHLLHYYQEVLKLNPPLYLQSFASGNRAGPAMQIQEFPCSEEGCGKSFRTQAQLGAHIRHFHPRPEDSIPSPSLAASLQQFQNRRASTGSHGQKTSKILSPSTVEPTVSRKRKRTETYSSTSTRDADEYDLGLDVYDEKDEEYRPDSGEEDAPTVKRGRKPGVRTHRQKFPSFTTTNLEEEAEESSAEDSEQVTEEDEDETDEDRLSDATSSSPELIRCICRDQEESGFMMQCERCSTWQHGDCFGIRNASALTSDYICYICENPPRQRESFRFRDSVGRMWAEGRLPSLLPPPKEGLVPPTETEEKQAAIIKRTQEISRQVTLLTDRLKAIDYKIQAANLQDQEGKQEIPEASTSTEAVSQSDRKESMRAEIESMQDEIENQFDELEGFVSEVDKSWEKLGKGFQTPASAQVKDVILTLMRDLGKITKIADLLHY